MRVLLADNLHIHARNFSPVFTALRHLRAEVEVETSRQAWWKAHGDYRALAAELADDLRAVADLDAEGLCAAEYLGVNLAACALPEFLCLVLPRPRWAEGCGANLPDRVIRRAMDDDDDARDLRLCMAAARNWLRFWDRLLEQRRLTHAIGFSGSYVYTRALQELCALRDVRSFVIESFFTGNEFYFEERTSAISNASRLGDPAWYAGLELPEETALRDALVVEAHRRLVGMRNKNVRITSRDPLPPPFRSSGAPTVLVIGQVLNDFSLINTPLPELSSLATYRELISRLLRETDCNVVFKAHPWERARPHLRGPLTLMALEAMAAQLPDAQRRRLVLTETAPIKALFGYADHVVGICSQGLLEASQAGLRPIQIGRAFFGGHGFTCDLDDAGAAVAGIADAPGSDLLGLDAYRGFESFLVRALVLDLVSNLPREEDMVAARLVQSGCVPSWRDALVRIGLNRRRRVSLPMLRTMAGEALHDPRPYVQMGLEALRRRRD